MKKEGAPPGRLLKNQWYIQLFNDESINVGKDGIGIICMDVEVYRGRKIQREDTHDGLGIDDITTGNEVKVNALVLGDFIIKIFDFIN